MTTALTEDLRTRFYRLLPTLLAENPRAVAVLAEVGAGYLDPATVAPVADRVINVGIREQLLVGTAGGLALAGMRPIVHTFAPFLIERPFEQVKLDLGHQGVGAVLVSAGGSYDWPEGGETHFGHRDVALLDTLEGWTVHVPGHPDEAEALLRAAVTGDGRVYVRLGADANTEARPTGPMSELASESWTQRPRSARPSVSEGVRMSVLRRGSRGTVVAVGPMADRVLAASADLDITVLYAATVRPFDAVTLRATLDAPAVVLVEPYLRDTSTPAVARALSDVPHRVLGLGVDQKEHRTYGSRAHHDALNGLDERGLRARITEFLR
jgi:transketolase